MRVYYDEENDLAGYISFTFLKPDSEIKFIDRECLINDEDWMTAEADGNLGLWTSRPSVAHPKCANTLMITQ